MKKITLLIGGLVLFQLIDMVIIYLYPGWQFILPTPIMVINSIITNFDLIITNLFPTLFITIISIIISIIIAYLISFIIKQYRAYYLINICGILQIIPPILLIPIIINIFGFSLFNTLLINVILNSFPLIKLISTSFLEDNLCQEQLFTTLNASLINKYRYLYLPRSIKSLYQGLSITITYSLANTLMSEYLIGQSGFGLLFKHSISNFNISLAFGIIVIVIIITLILLSMIKTIYMWSKYAKI